MEPSKYLLTVVSPEEEEEDPKAKKDAKKPAATNASQEEIEGTGNPVKIVLDTTNPVPERRVLSLSLNIVFQGEPYEDPNPPEEDEAAKKKKGGKDAAAEPEVRMITPDPVTVEQESGRQFEIELGRYEQVAIEAPPKEVPEGSVDGGSQAAEEEAEVKTEERWIQYKFD